MCMGGEVTHVGIFINNMLVSGLYISDEVALLLFTLTVTAN